MAGATGKKKADPAKELEVLFPDVELAVRDPDTGKTVAVTVREFRFLEGMQVRPLARPLIEALADTVTPEGEMEPDGVEAALAAHAETWIALLAAASGMEAARIARLSDADGDRMADAMWSANRDFLLRRVVTEAVARRTIASSSPPSSTPS